MRPIYLTVLPLLIAHQSASAVEVTPVELFAQVIGSYGSLSDIAIWDFATSKPLEHVQYYNQTYHFD